MNTESDEEIEWTRRALLERGPAPAIRGGLVDNREPEPGSLQKV